MFVVDSTSDLFKTAGEWSVCVRALGANDSILSSYSKSASIVRLTPTDDLSMTKAGIIAWSKVDGAVQYVVKHTGSAGDNYWFVPQTELSTNVFAEKLNTDFAGNVTVNLYALGDGEKTLTSAKTVVFNRLEKPVITYENNKFVSLL